MFQFLKRHIIKATCYVHRGGRRTVTLVLFFRSEARVSGHFLLFSRSFAASIRLAMLENNQRRSEE
jgi:hypothetical protein